MTEKIARRGIFTPDSFEADQLGKLTVAQVMNEDKIVLNSETKIREAREMLKADVDSGNYFITVNNAGAYIGIVNRAAIFGHEFDPDQKVSAIVTDCRIYIKNTDTLRKALEMIAKENIDVLPVIAADTGKVVGILSYREILSGYKDQLEENENAYINISLKRRRLKMMCRRKKSLEAYRGQERIKKPFQ